MATTHKTREKSPASQGAAGPIPAVPAKGLSPRSLLLPYQCKWVDDESRFKYGLWSRQTGKDFSAGEEGVRDSIKNPKTTWLIGAAGERQAMESLSKWKEWAEAYKFAIEDYVEDRESAEALIKSGTIVWQNGSRAIAVPANPDTVRGYSANVLLTEAAFIEEFDATWRAILPSITNPLRGGLKKIRLITTPNGVGNKTHELWQKNFRSGTAPHSAGGAGKAQWSCHKVTIHDAVAQGLPVDIEELREAIDDPEGWAQEFECEFMDAMSVLLSYELIATCESSEATSVAPLSFWDVPLRKQLVMGIDYGRKKDLTVAWTDDILGDVAQCREVLEMANTSTPDQVDRLRPRIKQVNRVCLDYTGPGIGMGDYLVKEFGEWKPEEHKFGKIELCNLSNPFKQDIFSKFRMSFEQRKRRVPISRVIREDLHSVHRTTTKNGQIAYKAPHTPDGHADRCTAGALANRAWSFMGGPFAYSRVILPGRMDRKGGSLC